MKTSFIHWICSGGLDLKTAQQAIASNWVEVYQKYVSPNPPQSETAPLRSSRVEETSGQVWVNTGSGKYWKPGSRFYGKTKKGEYMIHVRTRGNPERVSASERYRRMIMAVNRKLTNLIKGRVIIGSEADLSSLRLTFKDGSTMKVKTVDPLPPRIPEGIQVREVSEHGTEFIVGCEEGTTIDLTLAEPGNSVTVRDKTGEVEYLG